MFPKCLGGKHVSDIAWAMETLFPKCLGEFDRETCFLNAWVGNMFLKTQKEFKHESVA